MEWVGPIPKPVASAAVPNLVHPGGITGDVAADRYQQYLDPAPEGIDARWAWYGTNGTGAGVRICDLEKNLNRDHSDLGTVKVLNPGPNPANDDNHGTAVLGILAGENNGFGVTGIAHDASLYFAATTSTEGFSLEGAITRCAANLQAGDIIVIEAQTVGPNTKPAEDRAWSSEGLVPVEWYKPAYDAIKSATAAGRIVVEAGANGAEDLDSADYQTGNGGHYPFKPENDSGAILVGAGNSPYSGGTNRAPSWFTNTGATMDVQGWGDGIVTTGYGDLHPGDADPDDKNLWYKESFGGTSGATPIVAARPRCSSRSFGPSTGVRPPRPNCARSCATRARRRPVAATSGRCPISRRPSSSSTMTPARCRPWRRPRCRRPAAHTTCPSR
ncbi:MAG: S8 family serine peptidase [Caldilineaceae bacterium]